MEQALRQSFVSNSDIQIETYLNLPIAICDQRQEQSLISSIYTHSVLRGLESAKKNRVHWQHYWFSCLLHVLQLTFKVAGSKTLAFVNHPLTSTNLYPHLSKEDILSICCNLKTHHKDACIAFRSISKTATPDLYTILKNLHFTFLPAKPVYLFYPHTPLTRMLKSDKKLWESSPYTLCKTKEPSDLVISRILELYKKLYIGKHSQYTPQYTPLFLNTLLSNPQFELITLEKEGQIDAFAILQTKERLMTNPLIGYDTDLPQEIGLLRQLHYITCDIAIKKQLLFHQGAGAGHFKTLRGSKREIEYFALLHDHLSKKETFFWKIYAFFTELYGIQSMEIFEKYC